jgi:hypothetical protein
VGLVVVVDRVIDDQQVRAPPRWQDLTGRCPRLGSSQQPRSAGTELEVLAIGTVPGGGTRGWVATRRLRRLVTRARYASEKS